MADRARTAASCVVLLACARVRCAARRPSLPVGATAPTSVCRFDDARLDEISGMAWSLRHPGVLWLLKDSGGGPYLYAVDATDCRTRARVRLEGATARDYEAIATGRDAAGRATIWVGDTGDNRSSWPSVRVFAVPRAGRAPRRRPPAQHRVPVHLPRPVRTTPRRCWPTRAGRGCGW